MIGMTVDHEGRVFAIDDSGMPKSRSGFTVAPPTARNIIIMVNGFDYGPTENGADNPHQTLFLDWSNRIHTFAAQEWECFGFGWYSAELQPTSWMGGLVRGYWNPYRWGWELAGKAGGILAKTLEPRLDDRASNIRIIAHSMGVRVVLTALAQLPRSGVKRALLLNGSEYSQTAKVVAHYTEAHVLNVVVKANDVLSKLGSVFAPEEFIESVVGQSGLEGSSDSWLDICLDDPEVQSRASACGYEELRGDNPRKIADHWYTYTHEPNWKLFGDFLGGGASLSDLRDIADPLPELA